MKSFQTLYNLFTTYIQNTSTANTTLGKQLINDTHRLLLQKYFNNETTYSIASVGSQSLTATASLAVGATSATLTAAWTGNTVNVQVTFSGGDLRMVSFTTGSTAITWQVGLTATSTTALAVGGQQFYPMPPNYSKLKNVTLTVGNLQWSMIEILSRQEWDRLNVFPYYADIPVYFYIYPGGDHGAQVGVWPIPSTTGNVINYTYKYRVPDLSIDDYTTPGTVTVANGATAVTGTATTFAVTTNKQLEARWIQFAPTGTASTAGDNLWYQVASVNSTTGLTLYQPYQGTTVTASPASSYTIGQMPLINEDFHDLLVYRPLMLYFSSINSDPNKAAQFKALYEDGEKRLAEYCSGNTVNVNLGRRSVGQNPNLFSQSFGSSS